ncbi:phage tail protein [Rhizobium sp. RU36D]|uniref:phage tail-collar fiber domain-containing protein n=1 Tax=Rhizobium sp. RU36D TaxID=1907415 RepID=UPI0009D83479|nr:phage tail protein [Rhizobium sp. RU36D]SMD02755.1 Protein of unknown function [Rhizobium sp. RU36D]
MAQAYFSLVTTAGRNKLAASAAGGPAVVITHFAIGDGNGADTNPTAASTALVREVWRTPVESVVVDPDNPSAVLVTAIIPTTAGGWWMREFGVFDSAGTMIAVARPVSQYKPTALEGQLEDIRYEFQIIVGETANVTLLVDPSVLFASRDWVMARKIPVAQMMRTPWLPAISTTVTAPPGAPAIGDTYLVPAGATGAWAANVGKLAEWTGSAWSFLTPPDGHGISLPDGRVFERIGGAYVEKIALDAQSGKWSYAVAGGTANALTATLAPVPTSWATLAGAPVRLRIATPNTSEDVTLNVNGLGAKPIRASDGSKPRPGDLLGIVEFAYDPVNDWVQMLSLSRSAVINLQRSQFVANRGASSQLTGTGIYTRIVNYGDLVNKLVDSTFASGVLTIGAKDAGLWSLSAGCAQSVSGSTSGHAQRITVNGVNIGSSGGSVASTGAISHSCVSRTVNLVQGDQVDTRLIQTTSGDLTFNDYYFFAGLRLGAS